MKSTFSTLLNEKLINKIKNSFAPFQKKKNFLSKIHNFYVGAPIVSFSFSLMGVLLFFILELPIFSFLILSLNFVALAFFIYANIHKKHQNKEINLIDKYVNYLLPNYIIPTMNTETSNINDNINTLTEEELDLFNEILLIKNNSSLTFDNTVISTFLILKKIEESNIEEVKENKNIILNFVENSKNLSEHNANAILNKLTEKCSQLSKKEKIKNINNSLKIKNEEIITKNIVIKNI